VGGIERGAESRLTNDERQPAAERRDERDLLPAFLSYYQLSFKKEGRLWKPAAAPITGV
jgi:hypothetical protein